MSAETPTPDPADDTREPFTRIGAYGLIVRDDHILLCRLSAIVTDHVGYWTLPGGGLDFGEDPKAAVIREIAEETGLHATLGPLADVHSTVIPKATTIHHGIRIIYHIASVRGDLVHETSGSTDKCDWIPLARARQLPLTHLATHGLDLVQETR